MSAIDSRPRVVITYCTQCRWLLRATWLAQELLTTFTTDIGELALKPGTGGVFRVAVGEEVLWDRQVEGSFPDLGPLKRMVRDRVAPGRSLGHTDRAAQSADVAAQTD
ncbi:MAG TPA: SelT/SelW/SelH family protein [Propionibacteriaceae bacterium]|nr:SelT/SelW/SelH family protein [Propionibacteriaceae bacterium]